ncbi:MAG: M23 family metallopeptidase [Mucinivorans sp.]
MRIKLNRRGILFISFAILVLTIIILGIVWSVRSCSSGRKATPTTDSLAAFDTIGISYDESMSEDSLFTEDSTRAASKESSTQNYLERLVFSDMHKSLYGLDSQDYEVEAGEIQSGQTFSHLMNDKYNVNIAVINELIEKSKGIFDMRDLRAGKPYTALLSQDTTAHGALEYLVYEKSASEFIIFSTGDSVFVRKDKKEVTSEEKYAEGTITSSLWGAMYENGFNPQLAARLNEIYKWSIDFFAIQSGDSFRVIYEEQFIDTTSIGLGRIFGAEFIHKGKPYLAIRFEQTSKNGDKEVGYWDALGKNLRKNFLSAPLSFTARVSSKFGMRMHPITHRRRQHNGIDYAAPSGTRVLAVADGTVTAKGWDRGGGGNRLWVRHGQGLESAYLHLRGFASGVSVGSRVRQGQVIGYVGSTGASTGAHLDFRIRQKGKYIDPAKTPSTPTDPIKESNKTAFKQMKNDVIEVMSQYAKK